MRTLFSENIHTPSPQSITDATTSSHPWESHFNFPSSSSSHSSSTKPDEELTTYLQSQRSETSFTHGEHRTPLLRRKDNPRLAFMGMRRCGKSSIQKVIFQKMPPADTLYLESTAKAEIVSLQSFVHFESLEIPSHHEAISPDSDHASIFSTLGTVIWIIDSQDEYLSSINELLRTAVFLAEHYPRINFDVFIHKTDGLSEEYKYDTFREVRQRVQDELADIGYGDRSVSYYQTSIFDSSVYEAMSKVVQKLLPQLPAMEALLNKLCSTCRIQKAYLFDTVSKMYVATDASPTFLKDYEVCADYVDIIVDIKQLYGWHGRSANPKATTAASAAAAATPAPSAIGEGVVTFDRSGDTYIYSREINEFLSLICVMGKGSSASQRVLVDYNVEILHDALIQVFKV